MPINEYDQLASSAGVGNEYDAMLKDQASQANSAVKGSMFAAAGKNPEQVARALRIADATGIPVDVAERNMEQIQIEQERNNDYDQLVRTTPRLAKFLEDSSNAALVKDDLPAMQKVEDQITEHSMMTDMYNALGAGMAGLWKRTAQIPAALYDVAAYPVNLTYAAIGRDVRLKSPDWLRNNPVSEFYAGQEQAFAAHVPDMNDSVTGSLESGDYSKAGRALALQFVANAPQQAVTIASMFYGVPTAGLTFAGASTASEAISTELEAGQDPVNVVPGALLKGTIEASFESLGTFNLLKTWEGAIAKKYGKEVSTQVVKDFAKTIAYSAAGEGNEEAMTSMAQDLTDYITGVNPDALTGIGQRALDAGLVGAFSGGVMTGPSAIGMGVTRGKAIREATLNRDFYLSMGESLEAQKLRERMPERQRMYVEHLTQGGPVENIFLPVQAMETYFQSAKINPAKAAQDLGILNEYNQAKETGGDLQIPLSAWAQKVVGTEHYKGLADDIKFSPEGETVNQAKAAAAEERARIAEENKASIAVAEEFEQSVQIVHNDVREQLVETGFSTKDADRQAQLYSGFFRSLSERTGIAPAELFRTYGLSIRSAAQLEQEGGAQGEGQTLNQSARIPPEIKAVLDELLPVTGDQAVDDAAREELRKDPKRWGQYLETLDKLGSVDERAQAMGFGIRTWYHGTTVDIPEFKKEALGLSTGAQSAKKGFFFASDPSTASDYAELAREKGVIREGDKITTKFLSDAEVVDPVSMHDAQSAMDAWRSAEYATTANKNTDKAIADWKRIRKSKTREKEWGRAAEREGKTVDQWIDEKLERLATRKVEVPTKQQIEAVKDQFFKTYASFAEHNPDLAQKIHDIDRKNMNEENQQRLDDALKTGLDRAESQGQQVGAFRLRGNRETIHVKNYKGESYRDTTYSDEMTEAVESGKSAVLFRNTFDPGDPHNRVEQDIAAVFEPKDIRSKFAAFDPRFTGSANVLAQGGADPRGRIRFGADRQFNIDLLAGKDPSTFIHESGHFFLEVMGDLASNKDVAQGLKDDYAALLKWLGVESRDQIGVEQHEQFARGFEAYLMEGKAPTSSLRKAFATFKTWLVSVYQQAVNLDVTLSDEVRGIMDRLIATEEQINQAEAIMNYDPLFADPKAMGMNDAQAAKYIEAREEARLASEDVVRQRLMEDIRKKDQAMYRARKVVVTGEVQEELKAGRKYRALSILQTGNLPDGTPNADTLPLLTGITELKISKASIEEKFGKDAAREMPRGTTTADGVHVEIVAEMLGYGSGDQMVKDLRNAPSLKDAVKAEVEARMLVEFPDNLLDPQISEKTIQAVHNDKRGAMLRMELEHLAKYYPGVLKDAIRRVARRVPTEAAVRAQAERIIGSRTVRDIRPSVYQRAEIKAAKEAGQKLAAGDIDGAFEAKRRELLNHELYRAAVESKERIEKDTKDFKRLFRKDEDIAKSRDVDMVNAARAVLAQFGIMRAEKTAAEYLEPMSKYDPDTFGTVLSLVNSATENAGDFRSVKFDDFVAMSDAVRALWDLAKSSKEIEIDGKRVSREQIQDELVARIQEVAGEGKKNKFFGSDTTGESIKTKFLSVRAALRRVEHWTNAIDDDRKSFTKYIWQPVQEAVTQYRLAKNSVLKDYKKTFEILDKKSLTNTPIEAQELGGTFTNKAELLGAILHTGNESNLQKLLVGRGWAFKDADGNVDTTAWNGFIARMQKEGVLTKSDYDWAQAVWDLTESLKPGAQKAHKAMYGFYFNEITANEVQTPFGNYRGGYVPAVADPLRSEAATLRNEKELLERGQNSFMFPTTGRGFTKSRVESYAAPLSLDINLVGGHIDKVLRFTFIEPRVKEVSRIVTNEGFRAELAQLDEAAGSEMLMPWLQRTASQRINTPTGNGKAWKVADAIFTTLRTRTGMQIMAGNTINVLQNYTGILVAATKVEGKHLRNATWDYVRNSKALSAMAAEKSKFMENELKSTIGETQREIDKIIVDQSTIQKIGEFAQAHAYILQQISQNQNNVIVWTAAYNQALEQGQSEAEASRAADSTVRTTQSSMAVESVSRFETGSPFLRMFTQFYSYFNNLANLNASEFEKVVREVGLKKGAGRLFYVFLMANYLPAVMSEVIRRVAAGTGGDDDDDGEYMDDFLSVFFGAPGSFAAAQVPFVGQAATLFSAQWNDKHYDDKLNLSPSISVIESLARAPREVYDAVGKANKENKAIRDSLTALGVVTGLPLGAAARPLSYLNDVRNGEARPSGAVDFVRGVVTGKKGDK